MNITESDIVNAEARFGRFTHMGPNDKLIWTKFLLQGGHTLAPFEYDVRVGRGIALPADASDVEVRAAEALTTKRIDVVAFGNNRRHIIEVKIRAGLSAIGQLVGYQMLYRDKFDYFGDLDLWLITDILQPDLVEPLRQIGIKTWQTDIADATGEQSE